MVRLLATACPILVIACPAAVLGQAVVNTARVMAPAGVFEAATTNNEAVDNDSQLAVIVANPDSIGPINGANGSSAPVSVLTNDKVNGAPVVLAEVMLTVMAPAANPGVVLDPATGTVSVAPGVPAGTYSIEYQLCEKLNPSNCAQSSVTITVEPAVSAVMRLEPRPTSPAF